MAKNLYSVDVVNKKNNLMDLQPKTMNLIINSNGHKKRVYKMQYRK